MTPGVEAAFREYSNSDACSYVRYWENLTARTDAQLFNRFMFAFCSVHTSWESNVNGFKAIKDFKNWVGDRPCLRARLVQARVGLQNNRTKWISDFGDLFWQDADNFRRRCRESWPDYRDRIEGQVVGLGPAKVSFALELAFPLEAEVLCLDVHMLRLYGRKADLKVGEYHRLESDWVARARAVELPGFIVKQIHWDRVQGKPDSRYWSHVLEGE